MEEKKIVKPLTPTRHDFDLSNKFSIYFPNSWFPRSETEDPNKGGDFKLGSMHPHTLHITLPTPYTQNSRKRSSCVVMKANLSSNSPGFLRVGSWARLRVADCSYKHTLQTEMERVHPNWECLTRKRLKQLVIQRVHPFPSPDHLDHTLAPQPTPLLLPSLWDLVEEIHLCRLVARLVSANRSK